MNLQSNDMDATKQNVDNLITTRKEGSCDQLSLVAQTLSDVFGVYQRSTDEVIKEYMQGFKTSVEEEKPNS